MSKQFEILEETTVHHYYEFPDWVTPKYLEDMKKAMDKDARFRYAVLYRLLETNKDAMTCGNLDKFFGSWVYGYDVMN